MIGFLRRLWGFAAPYKGRLILAAVCSVCYAVANGSLILAIKVVVNLIFSGDSSQVFAKELAKAPEFLRPLLDRLAEWIPALHAPTSKVGVTLVVCIIPAIMLVRGVTGYLNVYLMTWVGAHAIADLRTRVFEHLQGLSLAFFDQARTGDLISRVLNDTQVLYGVIAGAFTSLVKDPLTVAVLIGIMLYQQPLLTGIAFVVFPVCLVPIIIYGRKVRRSAKAMQTHISDLTTLMHESFTANRIIRAYNLEPKMMAEFRQTIGKYISQTMRVVRANEIPSQLTEFLGAVGVALVLLYVAFSGSSHPGDFVAFIVSIVVSYPQIKALTKLHNQLHQGEAASRRVFELLEAQDAIQDPPNPVPLKAANADIRFEDIDFAYGEKPVLRGVSFTAKTGQLVALVGSSGSGKTTLTNLLLRFYDPKRGAVRIGDVDIRQVSIRDLRRQIALVAQETILFNDTIRQNILLGRPTATDAEIEAAARYAYAHDFIMEKPQGYDTVIGEKGALLSAGQRQRITIARAILKDAPILVLDEATSALDSESERAVQEALEKLMRGRTTLCIAHRLSTIQKADQIIVLDSGRVVETGTHDDLMRAKGTYCRLYELQLARED